MRGIAMHQPYPRAPQVSKYAEHKAAANAITIAALQRAIRINDDANERALRELERAILVPDDQLTLEPAWRYTADGRLYS